MTNHDNLESPKLRLLRQELDSGNVDALEAFWQEVVSQGTPLIEPIENDDTHSLVTFLWRAERELDGVAVISLLTGLVDNKLTRLLNTDVWYGTWKAANDLRATYQFEPIDPEVPPAEEEDMLARFSRYRHDPLNPLSFVFEKDEEDPNGFELIRSIIELPEAVSQPWIEPRDEVPKGRVELHRFRSEILANERRVWVYTPPGYSGNESEQYGMIILFDGRAYFDYVPTPTILDNLTDAELIPPMVAVFPDSLGMETRIREMILHSPFNEFLATELVPWVRANFRVTDEPKRAVIGGASAGGLAAAYVAFEHPETFGNVLSQSGAFSFSRPGEEGYEWLTRQFAAGEKLPLKFHLDAGSLETKSLRPVGAAPNLILANRNLRDALKEKGYRVQYHEFSGGHDYISWRGTFADGLLFLVGR